MLRRGEAPLVLDVEREPGLPIGSRTRVPAEPAALAGESLWQHVRGASSAPRPAAGEVGRRYVELLTDNFGQPGFSEVLVAVHDLDARRDLVGAILPAAAREAFVGQPAPAGRTGPGGGPSR